MTIITQDKPRPPWRDTPVAEWVRHGQRAIAARRFVRAHNRGLAVDAPVLNFCPMLPTPRAHIRTILNLLGMRIGTSAGPPGVTIAWDTRTGFSARHARSLPPDAINRRCLDISKSVVDRAWAEAAGYSIQVDPLATDGPIVEKSEVNGRHDGRVRQGPLPRRRGFVYQRYVDAVEDGHILELRTGVIGGKVPVVIQKWRPATNWNHRTARSCVALPGEIYSATEIEHLLAFAQLIGLEYGELDVLRDRESGRIYVLDANRTPYGPPRKLAAAEADRAARWMADAFAELLATRA
jgi:hypothetical protein